MTNTPFRDGSLARRRRDAARVSLLAACLMLAACAPERPSTPTSPAATASADTASAAHGEPGAQGKGAVGASDASTASDATTALAGGPEEDGATESASSRDGASGSVSSRDGATGSASSRDGATGSVSSRDGATGSASSRDGGESGSLGDPPAVGEPLASLPVGMRCLVESYPQLLCGGRGGDEAALLWCDGTEMRWDEGRQHADHDALLNAPNLKDQLTMRYQPGTSYELPAENFEPGRVRYEPFFAKMYGATKDDVSAYVTKVAWMPNVGNSTLRVTTINDVHERLAAVSQELEALPEGLRATASSTSGAWHWRNIRGTERLSVHSFGAAVDVGVEVSDFWRWTKPDANGRYPYKNRFPVEIVEVFERHGFIWGGKWYHYDTMHFEYRPELLHPACLAAGHRDLE